jgi:Siphovirus ReqiPepy6 Gp37-like protein
VEVYTLDSLLRRVELFESFESLTWTERYKQYGDFEMHIASTYRSRSLLKADTQLAMNLSNRVMKIESVEDGTDSDNRKMLVLKGRSIETLMYDRVAKESLSDLTTSPKWTITGLTAPAVARKIFHDICVTGILSTYDKIPFIFEGSSSTPSNIAEPVDLVTVDIEPTTVYDAISQLADIWNFGFRLVRYGDDSKLWFDVYMGADRTTGQTTFPAVVFSPQLDNLQNTKELVTTTDAKNVAYVYSPAGFQIVYADGVDSDVSGFERRVLVVNASDVTVEDYPTPTDAAPILLQKGNEALSTARTYQGFDGEISQNSQYKPGRDYNLGDLVEMRNDDGVANNMRVTEIIYASDSEGERSYPTLSLNQFINTGSWLSWLNNKVWADLTTEVWADQP